MMGSFSVTSIAERLGAPVIATAERIETVCTDSRQVVPNSLYVALRGERFDGHDFIAQAGKRGAVAAVVDHTTEASVPQLCVTDTRRALGEIANMNRCAAHARLIALTGSAGKTGTKEMIAAMLATAAPTLATEGNLNNEIGVPLTLLNINAEHAFAVIEMGAAREGDIAYLCAFAEPDIALITNAMEAHLEGFGSLSTIVETKGEIYRSLSAKAIAVLNLDDRAADRWREMIGDRTLVTVSAQGRAEADVRAFGISTDPLSSRFQLRAGEQSVDVCLPLPGRHQVANAVAAAGVAIAAGISLAAIAAALGQLHPVAGRMRPCTTAGGAFLIDDTYNANPGAMRAAIDALTQCDAERLLVVGTMAELGVNAAQLHREIGAYAQQSGIHQLFAVGAHADDYASGFGEGAETYADQTALITRLKGIDRCGIAILVKGSRSARMDRVVSAMLAESPAAAAEVH